MTTASLEAPRSRSLLLDVLLVFILPATLSAAMYAAPFIREPNQLPFGADTYGYLWRSELVRAEGVDALTQERTGLRKTLGERPAYPVLLNLLRAVTGTTALDLMWALPAAIAAAVAIAATGIAVELAEPLRRASGLLGLGVAASSYVAQTAVGYGTNLVFDVVALSVAVLAIRAAIRPKAGRWLWGGVLLGAGALFHWLLALLFGALVLLFAGFLAVGRVAVRGPARPPPGAAIRLAAVAMVAGIVAAAAFLFAPELPGRLPELRGGERFTELRLPTFDLELTLPLAALGGLMVWLGTDTRRRWSLGLLIPWAGIALVGLVGWFWLDLPTIPYRFAGFALGIPILIVLGALAIGRLGERTWVRIVAALLATVAAGALASAGTRVWWERDSKYRPELFSQVGTLAGYLEQVPGEPLAFLPYGGQPFPPLSPVRAGLPVELYERIRLFRLAEGVPPDLAGEGVLIHLDAINSKPPRDGRDIGPGVTLQEGPMIEVPSVSAPHAPGSGRLALIVAVCILTLMAVGGGWSYALRDLSPLPAISVSPAFGLAALGLAGTVASRLGVPLYGVGAVAVLAVTSAAGWGVGFAVRRRSPHPEADVTT